MLLEIYEIQVGELCLTGSLMAGLNVKYLDRWDKQDISCLSKIPVGAQMTLRLVFQFDNKDSAPRKNRSGFEDLHPTPRMDNDST